MMNRSTQPNYSREFDDISGVTNVAAIMESKRNAFEHALMNLESDRTLKYLVAYGTKKDTRIEHGLLNPMLNSLFDFRGKYLSAPEAFFDSEAQQQDLIISFNKAMGVVLKRWQLLQSMGYDWNSLCHAINSHITAVAKVFGVEAGVGAAIANWFTNYRESEEKEAKYRQRDELNAEALRAHSELAYFHMVGADKKIINQVRSRIDLINDQLRYLPIDPNNPPAFTSYSNQMQVRGSVPEQPANDIATPATLRRTPVNPATEEITVITRRPTLPEKKSWLKKIPLIGRWF